MPENDAHPLPLITKYLHIVLYSYWYRCFVGILSVFKVPIINIALQVFFDYLLYLEEDKSLDFS